MKPIPHGGVDGMVRCTVQDNTRRTMPQNAQAPTDPHTHPVVIPLPHLVRRLQAPKRQISVVFVGG